MKSFPSAHKHAFSFLKKATFDHPHPPATAPFSIPIYCRIPQESGITLFLFLISYSSVSACSCKSHIVKFSSQFSGPMLLGFHNICCSQSPTDTSFSFGVVYSCHQLKLEWSRAVGTMLRWVCFYWTFRKLTFHSWHKMYLLSVSHMPYSLH